MGKKTALLLPLCLVLAVVWAFAAAGGTDPLASLAYLNGVFLNKVDTEIDARLDAALSTGSTGTVSPAPAASGASWTEVRLKQGDLLLGSAGDCVMLPLSGAAQVSCPFGTVVDATTGTEVPSGAALSPRHRYLVAEDTTASFIVSGKTAVVDYQGACTLNYSNATDYNAMASALKQLNLFKGSSTGYGQGFDLEDAPTRLQAIIMFIRVLGEEDAALAWTGTMPFTDVARGSLGEKYIGYAYERGYTNGYTPTTFRPTDRVNARQYTEFLLRALGYSSAANANLSDALARGQSAGLLTPGEAALLEAGTFLRADLVYVSYYALDVLRAGTNQTLGEALLNQGVFTQWDRETASGMVSGWRL